MSDHTTIFRLVMWPGGGGDALLSTMDKVHKYINEYPPRKDTCYHVYKHELDIDGYVYIASLPAK